jgi:hypothetical protein
MDSDNNIDIILFKKYYVELINIIANNLLGDNLNIKDETDIENVKTYIRKIFKKMN